jgi:hypothetical protein
VQEDSFQGRNRAVAAGVDPITDFIRSSGSLSTEAAAASNGRWGDYYQMTVDPVDDTPGKDLTISIDGTPLQSGRWGDYYQMTVDPVDNTPAGDLVVSRDDGDPTAGSVIFRGDDVF